MTEDILKVNKFKKGDKIKLSTIDHIYTSYTQMIKRHPWFALRWVYKEFPNIEHDFIIKAIYKHCMKDEYDTNKYCIVIQDVSTMQIYMTGEKGIEVATYKPKEIKEYDDKGNVIHSKDSDGYEYWNEYNDEGDMIHCKNSNGYEYWYEYDDNGNMIYSKSSEGFGHWNEYADKGKVIHSKHSNGFVFWCEDWYDDKGNLIHYKNSDGYEEWKEYDDKGNIIHSKNSDGYERWYEYDYKGNVIHCRDSNRL